MNKKYYTISEVAKILDIKEHTLRYHDDILGKKLTVIRGRRYYKDGDIKLIKKALQASKKALTSPKKSNSIDDLMESMLILRSELLSAIAY